MHCIDLICVQGILFGGGEVDDDSLVALSLKTILENTKRNNLKKYGVEFTTQRKDVITKIEQTKQEKYGDPKYNNREKFKQTLKDNPEIYEEIQNKVREAITNNL